MLTLILSSTISPINELFERLGTRVQQFELHSLPLIWSGKSINPYFDQKEKYGFVLRIYIHIVLYVRQYCGCCIRRRICLPFRRIWSMLCFFNYSIIMILLSWILLPFYFDIWKSLVWYLWIVTPFTVCIPRGLSFSSR